ncbi:hypothetical protein [Streptomyces collinus]|uniref:hypothetical protein n=1 Tax=Streptomyces collinus TaxID=42684 RepID=UPI0037A20692
MDASWAAVLGGLVGAAAAATVALTPQRVQKRQLAAERSKVLQELQRDAHLNIGEVLSTTRAWLDYLRETTETLTHSQQHGVQLPDLQAFDEQAGELRGAAEAKLAGLMRHGLHEFYGEIAQELRRAHDEVRRAVLTRDERVAFSLLRSCDFEELTGLRSGGSMGWVEQVARNYGFLDYAP